MCVKYISDILSEIQTWCHYADTVEEINYGALYNWYAATDARNIASADWHVSTDAEFATLVSALGGAAVAGAHLMEIGNTYWINNIYGDNTSGFNGRGSGLRKATDGTFIQFKLYCWLWSFDAESAAVYLNFAAGLTQAGKYSPTSSKFGLSIRLIKDSTTLSDGETGIYTGNDGKVYRTICIGTQEWLADNLAETKYRNGDAIPVVTDNATWAALVTGAMCYYNNDISNA